jgi:cell wall-associated NlpC family hydrolase
VIIPDRRRTLASGAKAARALEGLVPAAAYLEPAPMTVQAASAPLRAAPDGAAEQVDQLLFGEAFDVLEADGVWVFGQSRRDGYVGWTPRGGLSAGAPAPTHRVRALRTFALAEPHVRSPSRGPFPINALMRVEAMEGGYARLAAGGWVPAGHLAVLGEYGDDPAAVALMFLGAPYVWGGRDGLGVDCSGLVQQALLACGRGCPRDSDQQQAELGMAVEQAALARNDLVFWAGHVGMMLDQTRLIHANVHHMAVAVEPLAEAVARIAATGTGQPTGFRRL